VSTFVLEQFLRERFAGWCVPGAVVHRGRFAFTWEPSDSIEIPQHGVTVMRAEHEAWLRAGHDPGDEDRS
jgi:hypothetical protein